MQLGDFSLSGSNLYLDGTLTTAELDSLNLDSVLLIVRGTLDNRGETLEIGPGTPIRRLDIDGGTIRGGVIDGQKDGRWDTGQFGGGATLDSARYLSLPERNFDFTEGFTWEGWVHPTSVGYYQRLFDFGNGPADDNFFLNRYSTTNDLEFYNNGSRLLRVSNALSLNEWQHFAVTITPGGDLKLFKNGTEIGSTTITVPSNGVRSRNYFGHSQYVNDANFYGTIDDYRLWSVARTPAEIAANYNQMLTGSEAGLIGYWQFEETAGLVAANEVAGGDAATWQGVPDLIQVSNNGSNRLDGVRLDTEISLEGYRDFLRIDNGLELNSTMTVGRQSRVYFRGDQSVSGSGDVLISPDHTDSSYAQGLFLEQA
ncbi:LamG domain-containing protein, partial [Roseiconus nitratireducens]